MQILHHEQIERKIKRLAYEIWEHNFEESEIILAGINVRGMALVDLLVEELSKLSVITITVTRLKVNVEKALQTEVQLEIPATQLNGKVVILVDDVANTGRTLFYALRPILDVFPKKVETAVLVDRKHKGFPIRSDYVGLSLSTTLNENIDVMLQREKDFAVHLN